MTTEDLTSLKFVAPKRKEINPDELTIVQATQVRGVVVMSRGVVVTSRSVVVTSRGIDVVFWRRYVVLW